MLNPGVGSTIAIIRSSIPQLGPREQAVAVALAEDPDIARRMGAAELGAHVGTSAATVTRACQSMGFDGYPHVRTLLVRDAGAAAQAARAGGATDGPLHRMFAEAAREVDAAPATVDLDAFRRSVRLVADAPRVALVGTGGSAATQMSTALRFLTAGIAVDAPSEPLLQLLACRLLGPGDAVLAISDSGESTATLEAAKAAHSAGASVIAVTSFRRSTLARLAHESLVIGASGRPWPESVLTSTILQTLLLNALILDVAEARGPLESPNAVTEEILRAVTGNRRPGA